MGNKKSTAADQAIVITTINPPTKAVKKFEALPDFSLFVAGDTKGPAHWDDNLGTLLDIETQKKHYPKLAEHIAYQHYARKNLAYLAAIKSGVSYIYESDDDNIPYDDYFPNFLSEPTEMPSVKADQSFNIYSLFTEDPIWPRGLPLKKVTFKEHTIEKKVVTPLVQQGLADLDPDVDAIYRLTVGKEVIFDREKMYSLRAHTYCPFNSQNTYWHSSLFPVLYLPSTVESRVTDIWRGYIAQRILWELDSELIFVPAGVYQERNEHDFMVDFNQELELYTRVDNLLAALDELELSGSPADMMMTTYQTLTNLTFFQSSELKTLELWLDAVSS